ncbi:MAG: HesA/MoeB/ThiF family protein [Deltaproteobacteria bacterium]|nr:HesA/MoeB/ThiF family protein [Deltaproteobacteria bacterium]
MDYKNKKETVKSMDFSEEQILRYSRQFLLNEIGVKGQERLLASRVLVIGAGGLGSALLMYLAGSGVGRIGIAENDRVDLSNLPRQILYSTEDAGRKKVLAASEKLKKMNPEIMIDLFDKRIDAENGSKILRDYELIIDCTDNFESRFLINRLSVESRKPLLSGAVVRFEGNIMLVIPGRTFCYSCIFEEPKEDFCAVTCADSGVLGSVVGTIATIMATEAIKFLLGLPAIEDNLLIYDGLKADFRRIRVNRNADCPVCKGLF